ncbi:hypothetical protein [Rheinheimera fenheensis]|uniref:hypothetical protein n=1 Tax=Rheinheimera fenheensis TaxID=3152295 RepID=UPI00326055D4
MNRFTTLALTCSFATALSINPLLADEVSAELQQVVQQQLNTLSAETQQQARLALQSSVLDLIAQQSARQDASELLNQEVAQANPSVIAE